MKFPGFSFRHGVLCLALVQLLSFVAIRSAFAVAVPTYYITGKVLNQTNAPIAGVGVSASATINGTNQTTAMVNTDSGGNYSIPIHASCTWTVSVNCSDGTNALSNLPANNGSGYSCCDSVYVTITNQNGSAVFVAPNPGNNQLDGYVVDTNDIPIAGVGIVASPVTDTNLPAKYAITDANGYYSFSVDDETWNVSASCSNLTELGFECVSDQSVPVVGMYYWTSANNFVAQTNGATVVRNFFTVQDWLGSGWYYLGASPGQMSFGYYSAASYPFIFHNDMGWLYFVDAADGKNGAYFYDFTNGAWLYTSTALWPYVYDFKRGDWMYYSPKSGSTDSYTSNPRWFLNLSTQKWVNTL